MNNRFIAALILLGSLIAPSAFAQMRIGWQIGDVSTVLTLAVEKKIFEKHGLAVELKGFPAGPAMLPALAAGEIDIAWMGEFPTVSGYANGLPLEVLLVPHMHKSHIRLVGNPAAGKNRTQFSISFFIFALLFLLFDLEILLIYPYVVSAYINNVYGLVIMLIFFLALTLGFAFELGKNALKIDSRQLYTIFKKKVTEFNQLPNHTLIYKINYLKYFQT